MRVRRASKPIATGFIGTDDGGQVVGLVERDVKCDGVKPLFVVSRRDRLSTFS